MSKMRIIVQGEQILKQIKALPKDLPELSKDGVVGFGETGNAHALEVGRFQLYGAAKAARKYLKVTKTTELWHGTPQNSGHQAAQIAPGVYEIYPQREVDVIERKSRAVVD